MKIVTSRTDNYRIPSEACARFSMYRRFLKKRDKSISKCQNPLENFEIYYCFFFPVMLIGLFNVSNYHHII